MVQSIIFFSGQNKIFTRTSNCSSYTKVVLIDTEGFASEKRAIVAIDIVVNIPCSLLRNISPLVRDTTDLRSTASKFK